MEKKKKTTLKSLFTKLTTRLEIAVNHHPYITIFPFVCYMLFLYYKGQIFIAIIYFSIIVIMISVFVFFKKMDDEYERIWRVTLVIVIAFTVITYSATAFAKYIVLVEFYIGSIDAWIGFAGSILGGTITMLALIFTINHEISIRREEKRVHLLPYIYATWNMQDAININNEQPIKIFNKSQNPLCYLAVVAKGCSFTFDDETIVKIIEVNIPEIPFLSPNTQQSLEVLVLLDIGLVTKSEYIVNCSLLFNFYDLLNNEYVHMLYFRAKFTETKVDGKKALTFSNTYLLNDIKNTFIFKDFTNDKN